MLLLCLFTFPYTTLHALSLNFLELHLVLLLLPGRFCQTSLTLLINFSLSYSPTFHPKFPSLPSTLTSGSVAIATQPQSYSPTLHILLSNNPLSHLAFSTCYATFLPLSTLLMQLVEHPDTHWLLQLLHNHNPSSSYLLILPLYHPPTHLHFFAHHPNHIVLCRTRKTRKSLPSTWSWNISFSSQP